MAGEQHGLSYMITAHLRTSPSHSSTLLVTRESERLAKTAQMIEFNGNCDVAPTTKGTNWHHCEVTVFGTGTSGCTAGWKLFTSFGKVRDLTNLWLETSVVRTVVMIRAEVVRFLTSDLLYVTPDGRTLDEVREGLSSPVPVGKKPRAYRLDQYDSWIKYIPYMKQSDNYADVLFVFGLSAMYNIAVCIVSYSYDKPHVYYLGVTEPTDIITVCYIPSAEHYYASRAIAPMTKEHAHTCTSIRCDHRRDTEEPNCTPLTSPTEHLELQENEYTNTIRTFSPYKGCLYTEWTYFRYWCPSVVIYQQSTTMVWLGASAHKDIKRLSKITNRKSRSLMLETPSNQQRIIFQLSLQGEQRTGAIDGPGGGDHSSSSSCVRWWGDTKYKPNSAGHYTVQRKASES